MRLLHLVTRIYQPTNAVVTLIMSVYNICWSTSEDNE